MTLLRHPRPALIGSVVATAIALAVAGCGSGSSSTSSNSAAVASASNTSTTSTTPAAKASKPLRVHILTPRAGSHTGQNLTVHVALTGTAAGRVHAFKYVLDGSVTRHGDGRLTFHGLAPGRQHLVVSVPGDPGVHAATVFIVRAPPAPAPATTPSAPAPTTTAPAPTTTPAPTTPTTTTTAPAPTTTAPAPTTTPAPAGGIPQGNGGDGDSDNNGGPSDGDGNV